jgi:hypothetical protein
MLLHNYGIDSRLAQHLIMNRGSVGCLFIMGNYQNSRGNTCPNSHDNQITH